MKKHLGLFSVLGMLVASGFGSSVIAQANLSVGGTASNFGRRSLAPGFTPDPVTVSLTSGGDIDVRTLGLNPACVGFVTRNPDFILRMTAPSPTLKVKFTVPNAAASTRTDTTLVVNTASGTWVCNDDANNSPNPQVNLSNFGAGQYDIWVGSYQRGANPSGTLAITEQ